MRSNEAFTLPEVLLSLVVLAVSMTLLLSMQTRSIFRIYKAREEIERIYLIKEKVCQRAQHDEVRTVQPITEKNDNPEMTIVTKTIQIHDKSSLKDFKDYLVLCSSEGTWKSAVHERRMKAVSLVYNERPNKNE